MSCFALIIIIITTTIFFFSSSVNANNITEIITQVCKASPDHYNCETSSLSCHIPPNENLTVSEVIVAAVWVSWLNLQTSVIMVENINQDESSSQENNITQENNKTRERCLEVLGHSQHRIDQALVALNTTGRLNDARAWLSSVLAHQYGCLSGLEKMIETAREAVEFFKSTLIVSTADALEMVANYDDHGNNTGSWAPTQTERNMYWPNRTRSHSMPPFGSPSGLTANVIVCEAAGCDYTTVQAAVLAAPNNSDSLFVIRIKAGIYNETVVVPFETRNVVFLGDGMGKTVITGSRNLGMQLKGLLNTYETATVSVIGDGFMAMGITVENTAGPNANQAVAFHSESDLSVLENCEFLGNQDTLYASVLRQHYKKCSIKGNLDFVFGGAAGLFEDCRIVIAPPQDGPKMENTVTTHARIHPAQSTGFVFRKCSVDGDELAYMSLYKKTASVLSKNYLGRPWREYSRTVFIECWFGAIVSTQGWTFSDGYLGLHTLYYGEFGNTGPGSNTSQRVSFSSIIPPEHVNSYSAEHFFG